MNRISRRTVLKGLGAAIGLPFLEAMMPLNAAGPAAAKAPLRMAFCYVPNGVVVPAWRPGAEGPLGDLPEILAPLANVKDYVTVLTGLKHDRARANGDGPGDHARAMATFLTGCQAKKTSGADIKIGMSVDQYAAKNMAVKTRFPSLEIGCEGGKNDGNCDSGYSCAYSANLSWRNENTPNTKETNPRSLFRRLFGDPKKGTDDPAAAARDAQRKSILDFVTEDANDLKRQLGAADLRKMDQYLEAVRDVEQRIARAQPVVEVGQSKLTVPLVTQGNYPDHLKIMCDLLALAFQGDLTRVATFPFANEGSNRQYRFLDVPDGHHEISHHQGDKAKLAKLTKINTFHVTQLAYLLEKLQGIQEGGSSLLDNCMIVYGSNIGDGNRHNHNDLPILLAGKGGGTIKAGRHVKLTREAPLMNLFLAMLDRFGTPCEQLGDSTGKLEGLS